MKNDVYLLSNRYNIRLHGNRVVTVSAKANPFRTIVSGCNSALAPFMG